MEAIADEGLILTSSTGVKKSNPLLREKRVLEGQLIKISAQLKLGNKIKYNDDYGLSNPHYWL